MNVALDTDRVSLIQGDTLEVLRTFADKSVDCIITDPPYAPHVHEKLGKERRNDGVRTRSELTFPPMTSALIGTVMSEYLRICRGWIISFTDFYNTHHWGNAARLGGGAWVRTGVWVKTSPMPQMTGDRPACGHEDIAICHAEPKGWTWAGGGHAATWRGGRDKAYRLAQHVLEGDGEYEHPNQKPAWLLQQLVGMFCPPGGLVLDPYFGSGTTAIGALSPDRLHGEALPGTACAACTKKLAEQYAPPLPQDVRVIGIEGDQKYVDLAISRIRETLPALSAA